VHPYLGRGLRLEVKVGRRDGARLEGDVLHLTSAQDPAPERVKKLLDEWYRAEALRYLPGRVAACWTAFARRGETMPDVRVRIMRSRWGSLTAGGKMSLSAYLMRAPAECIDYVIFHELCHLRVRNHSAAFYHEVERYVPKWRRLRVRLRGAGAARSGGSDTPMMLG
jgi:predicted metal-dependent hydrolase